MSEDGEDDGLTRQQWRRLGLLALGIGVLTLLAIGGVTLASHTWGIGGGQDGPPSAAFSVTGNETTDGWEATITHEGGDGIHPPKLSIEADGEALGTWNELGGGGADVVTPDSSLTVDGLAAGTLLEVVYRDGDERAVLGSGRVGS